MNRHRGITPSRRLAAVVMLTSICSLIVANADSRDGKKSESVRASKVVASASNIYHGQAAQWGPQCAFDGSKDTRWATDDSISQTWIAVDLGAVQTIRRVRIEEAYAGRVQQYELQSKQAGNWKTFLSGATLGEVELKFPPVTAREFRLNILSAKQGPTINEIEWLKK